MLFLCDLFEAYFAQARVFVSSSSSSSFYRVFFCPASRKKNGLPSEKKVTDKIFTIDTSTASINQSINQSFVES